MLNVIHRRNIAAISVKFEISNNFVVIAVTLTGRRTFKWPYNKWSCNYDLLHSDVNAVSDIKRLSRDAAVFYAHLFASLESASVSTWSVGQLQDQASVAASVPCLVHCEDQKLSFTVTNGDHQWCWYWRKLGCTVIQRNIKIFGPRKDPKWYFCCSCSCSYQIFENSLRLC